MFKLRWVNDAGYEYVVDYTYDGHGNQAGYTRTGWILHCIAYGKAQGLGYRGIVRKGGR